MTLRPTPVTWRSSEVEALESRKLMSRGFYLTAGGPDPLFGDQGVVAVDVAPASAQPLAVQADGKFSRHAHPTSSSECRPGSCSR